jgi:hypothetical protein
MGEALVKLSGKPEIWIGFRAASPGSSCPGKRRAIKGAVDLNGVEISGNEGKGIEAS